MQTRRVTQRRSSFAAVACLLVLFCTACSDPVSESVVLTADARGWPWSPALSLELDRVIQLLEAHL